ncbi:integrin alpha-PS3-like [Macrosteles quadrilineatus]|uniref:integrin alpha-PS3-like n=1 Tax=Macrosteles quadrilineatus TaxID=74068 RepID=UPI0023E27410|nr:integrin alpha-PS3-like [Macrosteles quadrilineatus]
MNCTCRRQRDSSHDITVHCAVDTPHVHIVRPGGLELHSRFTPMTSLLCLLAVVPLVWGFNLDPRHAVVLDDPESDRGSYFGYALGFWRQSKGINTTWLVVGAPQAQEEGLKGERVRQPGAVYKCNLTDLDRTRCYKLSILSKEDRQEQDLRWRWKIVNIPKRAWLGATITTENQPNGAVVVCAPRMKQMVMKDTWFIPGMCFYWKTDDLILPLVPLETAAAYRYGTNYRKNGFLIGLAQSGMSAHFVENSTTSQLVVGATGVGYFTGAMNVYEQDQPFSQVIPSLHAPTLPTVSYDSYLGYSVSSAKLHIDGRVSYLAGAPRDKGQDYYTGVSPGDYAEDWSVHSWSSNVLNSTEFYV